ncbi:spore germination protein [Paenibacillus albus]|uniref:Spore germination protein n=1 Tax=Paenibacillus albus TaxID=2495582 RepID=A0A3S9A227_9BACL|nr:spore germination protein [Paenibacillus albus]AZN39779.1 spore germination protein [Paenibacillus albus]
METIKITSIQKALFHTDDLIVRELNISNSKATLLYLETMCEAAKIELSLFKQLQQDSSDGQVPMRIEELLTAAKVDHCHSVQEAVDALIRGRAIICEEEANQCFSFDVNKQYRRAPEEPENERSLTGNRDGFIEQLHSNLNLIRKHLSTEQLRVQYLILGKHAKRLTALVWLDGTADSRIVNEAINRLTSLSSTHDVHPELIRKQLKEHKYSVFPQIFSTERVDFASALISRGRIAVLCDQSNTCLILPASFFSFLQTIDDLIQGTWASLLMRFFRVIGFLCGLSLPSIYIAIVGFNYEVLPLKMTFSIKSTLESVPYPPVIETLIMVVIFQLIAEATLRLPSALAQMTGVVGGIIISESLVQIGFVSNIMIVVIALTSIGRFVVPNTEMRTAVGMIQFILVAGATCLGFYGIAFALVILLIHVLAMEPFGVPYCLPIRSSKR